MDLKGKMGNPQRENIPGKKQAKKRKTTQSFLRRSSV